MFEFDIYFDWKHDIFVKKKHTFRENSRKSAIVNGVGGAYKTVRLAER